MYHGRYLAVSGVSMMHIDSETLDGVYHTTIWYFLLVGLYTVLNRGFPHKIFELDPSTHTSLESSRKGGSNGQKKKMGTFVHQIGFCTRVVDLSCASSR